MKLSAGILLYRDVGGAVEVLLVHPGGPFWAKKDEGAWSIPKGEYVDEDDPLTAALREFEEELGTEPRGSEPIALRSQRQSGKIVTAWAMRGDFDVSKAKSNTFELEWPPKSGKLREFPEVDRVEWFSLEVAKQKVLKGQLGFLRELGDRLASDQPVE